nr:hypothetical protein OH820_32470 [Streptomyces sp. NBC_00857]
MSGERASALGRLDGQSFTVAPGHRDGRRTRRAGQPPARRPYDQPLGSRTRAQYGRRPDGEGVRVGGTDG